MVVASATEAWCTEIPGGVEAACTARELLTEMFGETPRDAPLHALHRLTPELVTSAVLQAGAGSSDAIELSVAAGADALRISVTDPGHAANSPHVEELDPQTPGGMGLYLVEQISSAWGVERLGGHALRVLFELPA